MIRSCSAIRYKRNPYCSDLHNRQDVAFPATVKPMNLPPINQWVAEALNLKGLEQAEASRLLSKELRRRIDRAAMNKIVTTGKRAVKADEMLAVEAITGVPIPSLHSVLNIPLLDWVSAGQLLETHSQIAEGDVERIPIANDLGTGKFIALKVEGDSMDRISPSGSVIVVDLAERSLVTGRYYVFSIKGEATYKMWHADPPYLAPYSYNAANTPIFVKGKNLAVVGRVRRTVLDL